MTVPTEFIVLAGLLLVALVLWLLVPSGVFTFSVGTTAGGMGVLGKSDLAKRADALVAEHFAASYAGDPSKLPRCSAPSWSRSGSSSPRRESSSIGRSSSPSS